MPANVLALLGLLVNHAPQMTAASLKLWADVAHGEGGILKVQKAVKDFSALVDAAVTGANPS